ncbi:porin [Marinobacter vulgaris]|uniref:Porin n=1 Tax=Marinobacter vulgaris TaxID=1928331 RepID=A0A2V3ZQ84_9GAMM|nr:porin [Marinobacter vulgaris]PXX93522.1 porin [Marinobacter vulgaris]TSJ72464.1 porin [Marinobacter vulgaris]
MNNNNFRKSGLAIAMAAAMGASTGANAAIELYSEDGTSFSVDGYFNAFYVSRDDDLSGNSDSTVKMGFLPNTIGFNFAKDMGDIVLGGRSSFWTTINDSMDNPTDTAIDVRQFYATADGDFGQLLIGKDFGLYARSNIFLDEILMGFGSPGLSSGGVSFGNIRTGYPYPTPSAQITYRAPAMGGLNIAVAIMEPASTTSDPNPTDPFNNDNFQEAPRFESEISYATSLGGVDLTAWLNGRYQKSETESTNESITTEALGYGVKASIAGFSFHASGFTSEGDNPVLLINAPLASEEDADGFLVQGSYSFGANRVAVSYGETDADANGLGAAGLGDFETENTTIGFFHDVNSNFKLVAEYNMFEQEVKSSGAEAADMDTIAVGAVITF